MSSDPRRLKYTLIKHFIDHKSSKNKHSSWQRKQVWPKMPYFSPFFLPQIILPLFISFPHWTLAQCVSGDVYKVALQTIHTNTKNIKHINLLVLFSCTRQVSCSDSLKKLILTSLADPTCLCTTHMSSWQHAHFICRILHWAM